MVDVRFLMLTKNRKTIIEFKTTKDVKKLHLLVYKKLDGSLT